LKQSGEYPSCKEQTLHIGAFCIVRSTHYLTQVPIHSGINGQQNHDWPWYTRFHREIVRFQHVGETLITNSKRCVFLQVQGECEIRSRTLPTELKWIGLGLEICRHRRESRPTLWIHCARSLCIVAKDYIDDLMNH
jgi:hypothetical protein